MIEFLCPNGHRIRCQADHVGRAAKCPRCGVKFLVPNPSDVGVSEAAGSDSNTLRPEFTNSGTSDKKLPMPGAGASKEPQMEFLCPNGHRLHGPASLQGKPGQCPECGSRFRIPVYEDIPAEEKAESQIRLGRVDGRGGSDAGVRVVAEAHPVASPGGSPVTREEGLMAASSAGRVAPGQAMAALFVRLWDTRPEGATVELRLRDGETVLPHQFLKRLSQQSRQGVFAVQEADGTTSLVAVAWEAVARVSVRGLSELPHELKDEG